LGSQTITGRLRSWGTVLVSPIFPLYCPECGREWRDGAGFICPDCWESLPIADPPERFFSRDKSLAIPAIFRYDETMRNLVHQMKFGGRTDVATRLGEAVGEAVAAAHIAGLSAIVPVPLHPVRRRERGYDQVETMATAAAAVLNLPVRLDIIRRVRHTSPQSLLSDAERLKNVRDAFAPGGIEQPLPAGQVLLLDDVIHTGTTLRICQSLLLAIGVPEVTPIAAAR